MRAYAQDFMPKMCFNTHTCTHANLMVKAVAVVLHRMGLNTAATRVTVHHLSSDILSPQLIHAAGISGVLRPRVCCHVCIAKFVLTRICARARAHMQHVRRVIHLCYTRSEANCTCSAQEDVARRLWTNENAIASQ